MRRPGGPAMTRRLTVLALLLAAVTILAIALVFYTLVESFGDRMRYVMVALGSLCMVAGTVFALFIEFRA